MTFKEIEYRAQHFEGKTIDPLDNNEINKNIMAILKMCVEKNTKLNLSERDFVKILNIYHELYDKYYDEFLKQVANLSVNKLDFVKILKIIE